MVTYELSWANMNWVWVSTMYVCSWSKSFRQKREWRSLHYIYLYCYVFFNPEEEVRNHNLHNIINSQINSLDLNNEQVCVIVRLQDHPHSGVRTAPALIGQKSPHHHDFRTFLEHYFSIFRQVYLVVQYIFLQKNKGGFGLLG